MKDFRKAILWFWFNILVLSLASVSAKQGDKSGSDITLSFENFAGDSLLKFDTVKYINAVGQKFTISKLRYYISNIHLVSADGNDYLLNDYYLVDEDEPDSKRILLKGVPSGKYSGISFTLGVDSLRNCSGIQSGALDPVKGMFWAWNTGYIFLKIEGKSAQSTSPGNIIEFHIGGYQQPANCIRTIKLNFKEEKVISNNTINSTLKIKADALEIFKSPVNIDFSKLSSVTDFHNAVMIADNYIDMFTIIE